MHSQTLKATIPAILIMAASLLSSLLYKGDLAWNTVVFVLISLGTTVVRNHFQAMLGVKPKASDRLEGFLLFLVWLSFAIIPFSYIATPLFAFADWDIPNWLHAVGALFGVVGVALFNRSHTDLDRQWSVSLQIQEGHKLVRSGIYARVRHPMYTAIFLITLSQALLLDNWLAGLSGFLAFLLLYVLRVGREEAMMKAQFGSDWSDYAAQTPRLIPFLKPMTR